MSRRKVPYGLMFDQNSAVSPRRTASSDGESRNTRSRPTFGRGFSEHGAGAKNAKSLTDRARSTGNPQGQWLDNDKALEVLKTHHDPNGGVCDVELPPGMGKFIMPDGEIVEANYVRLVPNLMVPTRRRSRS